MVADHGEAGDPRPLPAGALDRDEAPVHLVGLSGRRPEALAAAALRGRLPPLREHARRGPPPAVPVGQGPEPVCPDRPRAGAGEPRPPAELSEVACLRVEPVALLRGHLPERRVYNLL